MGDYGSSLVFDDETQTFSIANNNEFTPFNVNDYIIMELECSKDTIYLGDIARLTATLHSYMHDGVKTPIQDDIPLRIAKFATTYGSLMPIKDYTHSNKATPIYIQNKKRFYLTLLLYYYSNSHLLHPLYQYHPILVQHLHSHYILCFLTKKSHYPSSLMYANRIGELSQK